MFHSLNFSSANSFNFTAIVLICYNAAEQSIHEYLFSCFYNDQEKNENKSHMKISSFIVHALQF